MNFRTNRQTDRRTDRQTRALYIKSTRGRMGTPTSHEQEFRQMAMNMHPTYEKAEQREVVNKTAPEHIMYNYENTKQAQEKYAVVNCPHSVGFHADRLAIVDLEEGSKTYCSVISVLTFPDVGDEPGRMNWTRSAPNLQAVPNVVRNHMVVPCMNSDRIYIVEIEEEGMKIVKTINPELLKYYDMSCPYAVHVLPLKGAPVHIATLGDNYGHGKGDFLLIDRDSFEIRERHNRSGFCGFGGDFSFQTRRNLLIACEWGHPRLFRSGFTLSDIENVSESFGSQLHVWQISPGILKESIELGPFEGCLTTTVRFLHNPECNHAFACSAIGSTVFHLHMNSTNGKWSADKVFHVETLQVEDWLASEMPALLTDLVISMNDRFAYVAGWLHGCIWQLDISDPFRTTVLNMVTLGGLLGGAIDATIKMPAAFKGDKSHKFAFVNGGHRPASATIVRGTVFRGGPAFLQLSLDGNRLYVSNSFYKQWDAQFYPDLIAKGGQIVRIDIDQGMTISDTFLIDLKDMEGGPYLARDLRFFTGDSTSDNFL
uniref:Selenium-binding protein n=1 Tax=Haemonchus contortus TaxID=6289 RepID=A0A7I4YRT0_HAECO